MQISSYKFQITNFRVQISDGGTQDHRLQISNFRFQISGAHEPEITDFKSQKQRATTVFARGASADFCGAASRNLIGQSKLQNVQITSQELAEYTKQKTERIL